MISDNALRRSVKILAWSLFIFSCYNLLMMIIVALRFNNLKVNFLDFVNLFATFGLLRWSNGWRKYCIVIFWLAAIGFGLLPLVFLAIKAIPRGDNLCRPGFWAIYCLREFYCIAALIILHHPRVKAMFAPPKAQTAAPEEPVAPGTPEPPADSKDATDQI